MNITLLGLSNSGKTCYLYSAAYILSRGININGHRISAIPCNRMQRLALNEGFEEMLCEKWPKGSMESTEYPFVLRMDGKNIAQFTLYDYRGGILYEEIKPDDRKKIAEINNLFNSLEDSQCLIIFVDGNTIINAIDQKLMTPEHRVRNIDMLTQFRAQNQISYIESIIKECNEKMDKNVPVLLTITKSDMFYPYELEQAKQLLKDLLPSVFAYENEQIVGITAVSLGENLHNRNNVMEGDLFADESGNVHLPILFALSQKLEESDCDKETQKSIARLFTMDKINFYHKGQEVYLI